MKKSKKIPEKSLQVLSCAMAVAVMILLLSGDIFMSKILRVNPNQEYPYDEKNDNSSSKEDENSQDIKINSSNSSYDVSFMKQVSLVDLDEIIQQGGIIYVFSGRSTCPPCRKFVPVLEKVVKDLQLSNVYYLDQSTIKKTADGYQKFVDYSEELQKEFGTTPYFMIFNNKSYQEGLIGMSETEESLEKILKNRILID